MSFKPEYAQKKLLCLHDCSFCFLFILVYFLFYLFLIIYILIFSLL